MSKCFKQLSVLLICFWITASNAYAVTFSQPTRIGNITYGARNSFFIDGATYNQGNRATSNQNSYRNGILRFGNEANGIYVHYDVSNLNQFGECQNLYGNRNSGNTFAVPAVQTNSVYQINSDANIVIYPVYIIRELWSSNYVILGKKNGIFEKYIDTHVITRDYLGRTDDRYVFYNDIRCNGNQIIISYSFETNGGNFGEFRFKWDDKAQWFGIEQVVY